MSKHVRTVKELVEQLLKHPPNQPIQVYVPGFNDTTWVTEVGPPTERVRNVSGDPELTEDCLILYVYGNE